MPILICFLLLVTFVSPSYNTMAFADTVKQVTVVLPTPIYKQPSIKSEFYTYQTLENGEMVTKDIMLSEGTVLTLDTSTAQTDPTFYKIIIYGIVENVTENETGYVLKAHTLDSSVSSPEKTLDDNATIKNDNTMVYSYDVSQDKYTETGIVLNKDTPVRVLDGYDTNKQYTYISFYGENNEILMYYVETANLNVPGINWSIIVAISTLITCLAILSIILRIKGRKKKKTK